jgi:preprotein translocase subunit Sss1
LVNSVKAAFLLIGLIGAIGAYRNPDRAVWIDAMLVASIGFILVDWLTWSPRY